MLLGLLRKPNATAVAAVNLRLSSSLRHQQSNFSTETHFLSKQSIQSLVLSHYHHGKFHNLLTDVVASPSLLLTACQSLTKHAPEAPPPLLSLDWVSTRFFSLQELSSQLRENSFDLEPCCFPVFRRGIKGLLPFATAGEQTLAATRRFGEKIEDDAFLGLIRRLLECKIVSIELGGDCLGRGLPQESVLSSILINVYFNRFDKEVQELRLRMNRENPDFRENDLVSMERDSDLIFYKPLKIYAVRYLDEILIITSGTKMMTLKLKETVVKVLELHLDLRVDRLTTVIHSAVSEKIDFMGMELQAVAPSVLRPPKTEKAIRARKKYLRQKEVRLLELKNARERNRKKLGLKLLKHVFKKFKQSNGFKFEFQVENEVRQIFRTWGEEVVQEFLGSVDEQAEWHRRLSAGDFLTLGRIRDCLPHELVDAYDNFQHQVDKYLKPAKARKLLEEDARRVEEKEEQKYAEGTIEDLTKQCIKVDAPIEFIRKAVKMVGFTNSMGRPRPLTWLMVLEDVDIIKWYAGVGRRWLDFYCSCHNFRTVKIIVSYHLRFSCILTLAEKHEATKRETMRHFTKDLKISNISGVEEVHFPSEKEIKMMGDRNLSESLPVDGALNLVLIRLASDEPSYRCIAHFCDNTDTTVYRIQLQQHGFGKNPSDKNIRGCQMGFVHESLHRKCAPLCCFHVSEMYMGRLTLQDIDCTALLDVD